MIYFENNRGFFSLKDLELSMLAALSIYFMVTRDSKPCHKTPLSKRWCYGKLNAWNLRH
jgi:hypothetical protein